MPVKHLYQYILTFFPSMGDCKTSKKSMQLRRKKASVVSVWLPLAFPPPPPSLWGLLLRAENHDVLECSLPSHQTSLPRSSHSQGLFQAFVVSIPCPLYPRYFYFFPASTLFFFFFSFSLPLPSHRKGGQARSFLWRRREPAPMLSAFTWIPRLISLNCSQSALYLSS